MMDIEALIQRAYNAGYKQGAKDTLNDICKTLERTLREGFAHLFPTEPSNCKESE